MKRPGLDLRLASVPIRSATMVALVEQDQRVRRRRAWGRWWRGLVWLGLAALVAALMRR